MSDLSDDYYQYSKPWIDPIHDCYIGHSRFHEENVNGLVVARDYKISGDLFFSSGGEIKNDTKCLYALIFLKIELKSPGWSGLVRF